MSRRIWRWDTETQKLVEVGGDWTDVERRAQTPTEELTYGGMRAVDGTDISSKRKHREYLKQTGLAPADDFKGVWAQAAEKRAKEYTNQSPERLRQIREDVGRTAYELEKKGRRK